ncbi:hypothetical protein PTTG_29535 [Puccinia triticina 1-1 BBBD Race 1]|uniref:Retrotransposon Copia-like N-terminal domain-containing protein n=2 Tax=Puccinia triticina TaxID=208348 RepID=A0A180G3F0_PUCT1|nr:uncharacterized protein PtA15_14A353 [Puccinia triticina]OAV87177.1 hypothetical protein PTTG_29535 [Puccinia triticina 1-1 BBBD Race 1]WAQ91469.1 hypothetical protein PtA15_14A353 [Puccinia triticina]WAR62282.1 hypothetical protein PtB15_14B377 [Puccinia triticina]
MTPEEENLRELFGLDFTIEKLTGPNFWRWRNGILKGLARLGLDDLVLSANSAMPHDEDFKLKKKRAALFIMVHLDRENGSRFVEELGRFEPKELWADICAYYASPTRANAFDLIRRLDAIRFVEGSIQESITEFRDTFSLLRQVSRSFFDPKTLEVHWIVFIRMRLPVCLSDVGSSMIKRNQLADISLDNFLLELEGEVRRQERGHQLGLAPAVQCIRKTAPQS